MSIWPRIAVGLEAGDKAALVTLVSVRGSAPRDAGAHMAVLADGSFAGTIGGGALEYQMLAAARARMAAGAGTRMAAGAGTRMAAGAGSGETMRQALGPALGQCCGGHATVRIEIFTRADLGWIAPIAAIETAQGYVETEGGADDAGRIIRRLAGPARSGAPAISETFGTAPTPLLLFGAGHVGRALVLALAPLPFAVEWVDPRKEAFPSHAPGNVRMRCLDDPVTALRQATPGSLVAVMTHSHPLDLAIVSAALCDARLPYVGLIGSETKKARFISQIQSAGLDGMMLGRLVCPIGGRRLVDKAPAVIAAAIAVELLAERERG